MWLDLPVDGLGRSANHRRTAARSATAPNAANLRRRPIPTASMLYDLGPVQRCSETESSFRDIRCSGLHGNQVGHFVTAFDQVVPLGGGSVRGCRRVAVFFTAPTE